MSDKISKCDRCGMWKWQCRCLPKINFDEEPGQEEIVSVGRKVGDVIEHKPGRKTDEEIKKANEGIVTR